MRRFKSLAQAQRFPALHDVAAPSQCAYVAVTTFT
jgi:hypothetical protein